MPGIELKRRGISAVLIDKGCVVETSLIYNYPTTMVFFTTPELLEIGDIPMTSLNDKPVRTEALKYYRKVAEHYKLEYPSISSMSATHPGMTARLCHAFPPILTAVRMNMGRKRSSFPPAITTCRIS